MEEIRPTRLLASIRRNAAFRAYVSAIGARIDAGRSEDAMFLLRDAGAQAGIAWQIVDQWPGRRWTPYRSRQEAAAARLACFVPGWHAADWDMLLARGLERLSDFKKWRETVDRPSGPETDGVDT